MTICDNMLQLYLWLEKIDEIDLNALGWDPKCVLTLWETSRIGHNLVRKLVDNGIVKVS
jgi:hypothetical protein